MMNELQNREFQLLKEILAVCEKLEITCFLVCGSALGAAKYGGFIPWDDDVDVAMRREEYEVFCRNAPQLLPDYYFLQNYHTDPFFPMLFSKVRDSRTTYIEQSMSDLDIHHGVYVDVFPIDGYPNDRKSRQLVERRKKIYEYLRLCCLSIPQKGKARVLTWIERLCKIDKWPWKIVETTEKCLSDFSTEESEVWCNHGNWQGKLEYAPKSQYGEGTWATFEGLRVRVPERIDEYLTQKYGDWRAELPPEQQVGHHYAAIIDLNRPYTEYVINKSNGRIEIKATNE